MKLLFSIFVLLAISFSALATEQETDLLINGNDTIYLKTFPLERLQLKFRPFEYTRETALASACWRGYRAVWRIEDDKLYLEKIIRCNTGELRGEENIIELFQKNGLTFQTKNQMILANWYTQDLYRMKYPSTQHYRDNIYLYGNKSDNEKEDDVLLIIEKGYITKKQLRS